MRKMSLLFIMAVIISPALAGQWLWFNDKKTEGNFTVSGNITADFLFGDGSYLSNLNPDSINDIWVNESGDTMTGNIDMNTNLIQNIGSINTDFTATGGLNLADTLQIAGGYAGGGIDLETDGDGWFAKDLYIGGTLYTVNVNETNVNGSIKFGRDNTFDVGNQSHRARSIYFATSLLNPYANISSTGINSAVDLNLNNNLITNIGSANTDFTSGGGLIVAGSVGIGTTAPDEKLHVEGSMMLDSYNNGGNSTGLFFREGFDSSANTYNLGIILHDDGDGSPDALAVSASDGVYFSTGGNTFNPNMVVTGAGNVGIGTVSPGAKLDVAGGNINVQNTYGIYFEGNTLGTDSSGIYTGAYNRLFFRAEDTDNVLEIASYGIYTPKTGLVSIYSGGGIVVDYGNTGEKLYFGSGKDTSLYRSAANTLRTTDSLTVDGNVGIGTTLPTKKLQVVGGSDTSTSIISDGYVEDVSGILARNYVSSHSWTEGTGSVGIFNQNGLTSENSRLLGVTPYGDYSILWKATSDTGNDADGGWNTDYFDVDNTKTYRFTVWIKKSVTIFGVTYFGTSGSGGNILNLDGTANSNPYFWSGDLPSLDKWYLLVGYVHSSNYAGTTSYGGIYDGETGEKVQSITDFKMDTSVTKLRHRSYLYYDTTGTAIQYWYDPRVEEVNGNEPTIESLLGVTQGATKGSTTYFGGNVGIGTTPSTYHSSFNAVEFPASGIMFGNSVESIYLLSNAYYDGAWKSLSGNDYASSVGLYDGTIRFRVDNSAFASKGETITWDEAMVITNSGNVGIGTTSPLTSLYVEGNSADWNEATPGTSVGTIHLDPGVATNNFGNAITFGASDASNGQNAQAGIYVRTDGTYGSKMYFATTNSYVTGSKTAMMLDKNGNVGIGTSSPATKLDVAGSIKFASGGETCSSTTDGAMRYYVTCTSPSNHYSVVEVCMKTGPSSYSWTVVKQTASWSEAIC